MEYNFCTECGNKLKADDNFCTKCGGRIFKTKIEIVGSKEYETNKDELEILEMIVDNLNVDKSEFKFVKPCEDYSTLKYGDYDLIRLKCTDRTKWIKLFVQNKYSQQYLDSGLFEAQKKYNEAYWKSNIKNIYDYKELILLSIKSIDEIEAQKKD